MKHNLKAIVFFLFVVVFSPAACKGQITATLPPQEQMPSFTPPVTPTATYTALPPLEATRFSAILTQAPTQTARVQQNADDCNGYPDKTEEAAHDRIFSPSGNWYIAYCTYPDNGANYTKVLNARTGDFWDVPYLDYEGQNRPEGMSGGQMYFKMWSSDEKFAYFSRYYCCVDGPGMIFSSGFGLYQLDLSNGKVIKIESGTLSPDGYSIIFHDPENHQVLIKDLKTRQTTPFEIGDRFGVAGVFLWSRDGSRIVFSATDENWFVTNSNFVMYLIDVKTKTMTQLLPGQSHHYVATNWLSDTELSVEDEMEHDLFVLNTLTNEVTPISLHDLILTASP